jgi:hypothetical protein
MVIAYRGDAARQQLSDCDRIILAIQLLVLGYLSMTSLFICIAVTVAQIADALVFPASGLRQTKIAGLLGALALLLVLINADMFLAFNNYNMKGREIIRHLRHQTSISLNEPDLDMMRLGGGQSRQRFRGNQDRKLIESRPAFSIPDNFCNS